MLTSVDERELQCSTAQPLFAWRIFRVRQTECGFMLTAPLIHNPGFESFPAKAIVATCYGHDHPAPAAGCRCGLYAVVDGSLDSLSGYLLDSAHDQDPAIYAEVACTGKVFIDHRGIRAERIEITRLAAPGPLWPDPEVRALAVAELGDRYRVAVADLTAIPQWVLINAQPQGAPPEGSVLDLNALLARLGHHCVERPSTAKKAASGSARDKSHAC